MNKSDTQPNIPLIIAVKIENRTEHFRNSWVKLPITKDFFHEEVSVICDSWDDLIIDSYYTTIPCFFVAQLMETPLSLVNHLAARLQTLDSEQILKLFMLQETSTDFDAIEQIIDYTYQLDKYELIQGVTSYRELGNLRKSELDVNSIPPYFARCIHTIPFGIEAMLHENGCFTPLGYISRKDGCKKKAKKRYIPACLDIKGKDGEEIVGNKDFSHIFEHPCIDEDEEMEVGVYL